MAAIPSGIVRAPSSGPPPSRTLLHHAMVAAERGADIVIQRKLAVRENCPLVAILAERVGVVRLQDGVGAQHAVAEGFGAFAAKALVADLGYLVDQVDVEV